MKTWLWIPLTLALTAAAVVASAEPAWHIRQTVMLSTGVTSTESASRDIRTRDECLLALGAMAQAKGMRLNATPVPVDGKDVFLQVTDGEATVMLENDLGLMVLTCTQGERESSITEPRKRDMAT